MARARRTLDRKTLREQGDAAERKKKKKKDDDTEETEEEEEEEDEDADEEASGDDEGGGDDDGGDDDDEDKPKKKKKAVAKKKVAEKKPAKPRSRSAKVVRMKVVWVVYSNSHQPLEEFPYPKKKDAEAYLEKVTNDKKSGGPFFLQPLKKPMEKDA
jgi:hypothetical protein